MSKKILIVDDDPTNLKLLQVTLQKEDFEIVLASDGDVGIERVKSDRPDLIILDVDMPKLNGYFFIAELKTIKECAEIPFIIITSHEEMKVMFDNKGALDYIIKPVDITTLIEKIKIILA